MSTAAEDLTLPKAMVKRLIKRKLSTSDNPVARDANVSSEALLAFTESGKVFISYLTATANDICQEGKRQTVSADDVLAALEDLEFGELAPALRESLDSACAQGVGCLHAGGGPGRGGVA